MHYEAARAAFGTSVELLTAGAGTDHDLRLADAYSGLGWSELRLQDCERATAAFETALTLDTTHPTARSGLRECQGLE